MTSDNAQTPLLTVGITGGIGCGKTSVCRILEDQGCLVFHADQVAKDLQESHPDVISGLKDLFGPDIYPPEPDPQIPDRKRIAGIVFRDKTKLAAINALIHPKVFEAYEAAKQEAISQSASVLIKEAAILFESGGYKGVDKVIVVAADEALRIARVQQSTGLSEKAIRARMASQWPQEKLIEKADWVIYNNGNQEELRAQTKAVLQQLLEPLKT